MSVDTPTDLRVKITRHEVPGAAACDLGTDSFRLDDVVTVECGSVVGTISRSVDYDSDGDTREVDYEVRIDGSDETAGFGDWCSSTPSNLDELTRVALALEAEWEALQ